MNKMKGAVLLVVSLTLLPIYGSATEDASNDQCQSIKEHMLSVKKFNATHMDADVAANPFFVVTIKEGQPISRLFLFEREDDHTKIYFSLVSYEANRNPRRFDYAYCGFDSWDGNESSYEKIERDGDRLVITNFENKTILTPIK